MGARCSLSDAYERLEQIGKTYFINGEKIKSRKKTSNKWFETQDSISYWDDFSKPKIIFQEIVQESQFLLDKNKGLYCNDTGRIIVGKDLDFLIGILNSKLFFFAVKHYYGGGVLGEHGIRMKHTFFGNFSCIARVENITKLAAFQSENYSEERQQVIDEIIFNYYNLTNEERLFIDSQ